MDLLSPTADRAFRKSFTRIAAVSAFVHIVVLAGIVTYAEKSRKVAFKGPVYTVNLLEVPRGAKAAAMGLAPPVRKSARALSLKSPKEKSLALPSKAKLKRPPPMKKAVRSSGPKAAQKKTLVAATGSKTSTRGASISLDAASFPFTYYLRAVERKISSNWEPVVQGISSGEARRVIVAFRITRDGSVQQVAVEKSSGLSFFDQSALRAVKRSAPLPPLPDAFPEDSLGIHFGFHYQPEG